MHSMTTYDEDAVRCPALIFKEGRFWCSLALRSRTVKKGLHIGAGCIATLFNTQREAFLEGEGGAYLTDQIRKGHLPAICRAGPQEGT